MFRFIKQIIISAMMFFNSLLNVNPLECVLFENQECKVRPEVININSSNPMFYPFIVKINRCSGSCNNINDLYAKICVPDTVKDLNVKVFNLMSRTNETRHIKWHETCKCICRLDKIICNSKQRWNKDRCRCECKELIDKGVCDKAYVWNPSNGECECDKFCNIGEYLDYPSRKCKKILIDPLVEECTENIDEAKLVKVTVENENKDRCHSYIVYILLFWIFFVISCGTIICIVYHGYVNRIKYNLPY